MKEIDWAKSRQYRLSSEIETQKAELKSQSIP